MKTKLLIITCAALMFAGCKTRDDAAFNAAFAPALNDIGNKRAELSAARAALRTNPSPETVRRYNAAALNALALKDAEWAISQARKNWKP